MDEEERVMGLITKKLHLEEGECWRLGRQHGPGYSYIRANKVVRKAHVVLYEYFVGPIPNGYELDHVVCGHKWCCNPYHVEPVTHKENCRRAMVRPGGYHTHKK